MKVLLGQLAPVPGDIEANAAALIRAVREHREADLAVFPELCLSGYRPVAALAWPDPVLEAIADAAADAGATVMFGFAEAQGDRWANAVGVVAPDGSWQGSYHKTHLFGDLERRTFVAGDRLRVFDAGGLRIGALVCFDMEFPEPARALAQTGAGLLVTCSANMAPYGPEHALASRARALDNRLPHVYVNRVGDEAGLHFVGGSAVIDTAGNVVAALGSRQELRCVDLPDPAAPDKDVDYLALLRPDLPVQDAAPSIAEGGGAR